jgi:hypothetical protein
MTLMLGFLFGNLAEIHNWKQDTITLVGFSIGLLVPIILTRVLDINKRPSEENDKPEDTSKD